MAKKNVIEKLNQKSCKKWNEWRNSPEGKNKKLDVSGYEFKKMDLSGYNFSNCNLKMANFINTKLVETDFSKSNLSKAKFEKCELSEVSISDCELSKVSIIDCIVENVDFSNSMLNETLWEGHGKTLQPLKGLDFQRSKIKKSKFIKCEIIGWNAKSGDFTKSSFQNCRMKSSRFSGAKMRHTNCTALTSSGDNDFRKTDFVGSDIAECISCEQFAEAKFIEYTKLDSLRNIFRHKSLGIIGNKGVGKTCLIHFLKYGSHLKDYTPTLSSVNFGKTCYKTQTHGMALFFKDIVDVSGDSELKETDWENVIRNSDIILYVLNVAELRGDLKNGGAGAPGNGMCTIFNKHIKLIHDTCGNEVRLSKKQFFVIGTHCDKDDDYKKNKHDEYEKAFRKMNYIDLTLRGLNIDDKPKHIILGRLDTFEGSSKIFDRVSKLIK